MCASPGALLPGLALSMPDTVQVTLVCLVFILFPPVFPKRSETMEGNLAHICLSASLLLDFLQTLYSHGVPMWGELDVIPMCLHFF